MRGLTLIELLVAIAMSIILSVGLYYAMKYSVTFFSQDKAVSDLIEYARTAEEQLKFYFDRWGNGVPSDEDNDTCEYVFDSIYPANRYCIIINSGSPCDEIIFYGNTQGFLIVLDEKDEDYYNALACRMTTEDDDYYYVWNQKEPLAVVTGEDIGVSGGKCGVNDSIPNASINKKITDINGDEIELKPGYAIVRVPKVIRIYCSKTDNVLYLKLSEQEADKRPSYSILAPVEEMTAELLPEGCNPLEGECSAVRMTVTFSNKAGDKTYTFTKDIVLGR